MSPASSAILLPFFPRRRAFTAVELVVVLMILVTLASIAFGLYAQSQKNSVVASEAAKIKKLCVFARSNAIRNAIETRAVFWLDKPSYWADQGSEADGNLKTQIITPERVDALARVVSVDNGTTATPATSGVATIAFYPDGSSDNSTIYLIHSEANPADPREFYTIKIYGPTGKAHIFEKEKR
jgi:prepilin-type N-terminal cleavage/methylation domain-containing protein